MVQALNAEDFGKLIDALLKPSALTELGLTLACVAAAWALVRLVRGEPVQGNSIWFGRRIFDGVFFPVLALLLALLAAAVLAGPLSAYTAATAQQLLAPRAYVEAVMGAQPVPPAYDVRQEMRARGDAK